MESEPMRQHRIAWIPWILALVALLGINAFVREDFRARRGDADDVVGLSIPAKNLGTTGRFSDPLVFGPPPAPIDTAPRDCVPVFVKLDAGEDFDPASMRRGVARGRAPPLHA